MEYFLIKDCETPLDKSDIGFVKAMARELLVATISQRSLANTDVLTAVQTAILLINACKPISKRD
tara:strand:+ start:322 stop:516 length:195 start_codon:yes stop_codon:yes gene_type:complete